MAALTTDKKSIRMDGALFITPVAATTIIYAGALVNADAAGHAVPASDTASHTFIGKAEKRADNSSGAAADTDVEGRREGVYRYNASGMTQANLNDDAYIVDDNTVGPGIAAQPVNVTGVTVTRIATTRGGAYTLSYVNAANTLAYGGGAAVDVSAGGDFTLTASDGAQILATVVPGSLPGADQSDNLTLRHVRCGKIVEVTSAATVFVDLTAATRS